LSPERRDFYQRLIDAGPRLNLRYQLHRNMTIVQDDAQGLERFSAADERQR